MEKKQKSRNIPAVNISLFVGLVLLIGITAIAYYLPIPNSWQRGVFITILSLAAAGVATIIPGFLEVQYKGLLRAGGAISVFCIVYFFKPQPSMSDQPFNLTVFVHGPNGKQDVILENNGHLIIDFGQDRRKILIGESGRTVFSGIPGNMKDFKLSVGLDAPGYSLVSPQSEYLLSDEQIYLAVKKEDSVLGSLKSQPKSPTQINTTNKNCSVFGIVKDKVTDKVVSKSTITLLCDEIFRTESASDGTFVFPVSDKLKGDQCLIRAEFNGKSKEFYIPLCDPNLIEIKIE